MIARMSRWLNYHHFRYFWTIAHEGSIAAASRKLRVGQSALSMQLKQFEETIGVQLFHRQGKNLILNDAGVLALQYADRIYALGERFLNAVDAFQEGASGGMAASRVGPSEGAEPLKSKL